MKKKSKKIYFFVATVLILVVAFLVMVNQIKDRQKVDTSGKQEETKKITDYQSDEKFTIQDIYKKAGASGEICSVAFSFRDTVFEEDKYQYQHVTKDKELIQKVTDIVNELEFSVCDVPSTNVRKEATWCLWLGIDEEKSIQLEVYDSLWEGTGVGSFIMTYPSDYSVYSDGDDIFMVDYYENGMFFENDELEELLKDLALNHVSNITMNDISEILKQKPTLEDFKQYFYEDLGMSDEENGDVRGNFRLDIEDYEGYLLVQYDLNLEQVEHKAIEKVFLYNDSEELQEVLYTRD